MKVGKREQSRVGREALIKGVSAETGAEFREFIRDRVRDMMVDVMNEEVEFLRGPCCRPEADAEHFRAGSAPGYVLHEGRRQDVIRPRVRRREGAGTVERVLSTYTHAQDPEELRAARV